MPGINLGSENTAVNQTEWSLPSRSLLSRDPKSDFHLSSLGQSSLVTGLPTPIATRDVWCDKYDRVLLACTQGEKFPIALRIKIKLFMLPCQAYKPAEFNLASTPLLLLPHEVSYLALSLHASYTCFHLSVPHIKDRCLHQLFLLLGIIFLLFLTQLIPCSPFMSYSNSRS